MAKMCFPTWVKYNDRKYPPHTTFEVRNEDVTDLQKAGGWLVESVVKETPIPNPVVEELTEEPVDVEEKATTKKKGGKSKKQEG